MTLRGSQLMARIGATSRRLVGWLHGPRCRQAGTAVVCLLILCTFDADHLVHAAGHFRAKPWFDAKGMCVFPLAPGTLPKTRQQFIGSLTKAYTTSLRFPEPDGQIIEATGGRYPALGSLRIRLAGGIVDTSRHEESLRPSGKVEGRLTTRQFELDGSPILIDKAKLNIHFTAADARLEVEHDKLGRPMVMLTDARHAEFQFQSTRTDLERALLVSARDAGSHYGVSVQKVKLRIETPSERAIDVDLHLSTKVGFIPAGMRFQAHVDIDDEMNAKLTNLKCDGDDALGPLIIGLIRPGLKKYEGKSKPLFGFPSGQLRLRDVKIEGGDELRVSAEFSE